MAHAGSSSPSSSHFTTVQHYTQEAKIPDQIEITDDFHPHRQARKSGWWRYRQMLREAAAEFAGVMFIVIFGCGAISQVNLSSNALVSPSPRGSWISINFGMGLGVGLGVWVSGGISGGHINPAVTLALATWRRFPWKKVPVYLFSQLMGGLVGAAIVYANYFHAIDIFEGGRGVRTLKTAGFFATYSLDYMTNVSCFFSEFLATAVLMIVILAATDKRNTPPPAGLLPFVIFLVIFGIGASLGMETGFALNPARDLGPRLLTSIVGYGKAVYTYRNEYWIWCPVLAPILGAQGGAAFYDALLYDGDDNLFKRLDPAAQDQIDTRDDSKV